MKKVVLVVLILISYVFCSTFSWAQNSVKDSLSIPKEENYNYHSTYGSDIVDQQPAMVHAVKVSTDGLSAKLTVSGMRLGFYIN